jgi:hypothetical protein
MKKSVESTRSGQHKFELLSTHSGGEEAINWGFRMKHRVSMVSGKSGGNQRSMQPETEQAQDSSRQVQEWEQEGIQHHSSSYNHHLISTRIPSCPGKTSM